MGQQSIGGRLRDGFGLAHDRRIVQRGDRRRAEALDLDRGMHAGTKIKLVTMQERNRLARPKQEALSARAHRAAKIRDGPTALRMKDPKMLARDGRNGNDQVAFRVPTQRHGLAGTCGEGQ